MAINREISLGDAEASLELFKPGKAAGPDKVFTDLLLEANEELVTAIQKLFSMSFSTGSIQLERKKVDAIFYVNQDRRTITTTLLQQPTDKSDKLSREMSWENNNSTSQWIH